jgi:SAM-dependent methyltransferase
MDNFDFKEFYDHQPDYAAFRNDTDKRREYDIAVTWKVNNLCSLVPDSISFSNILEIGCAMGILLNKVSDSLSIKDRAGLDISAENIKLAKQLFPECTFIQGKVEDIELILLTEKQGKKFDLVILSDIVEHIPDDLDFMKKVSGISSYVMINLPLEKCYRNRNRNYGVDDPSGHLRNYNRHDAERLAESAGFKIIASFTANAHYNKEHFQIYWKNMRDRIRGKSFFKKVFWTIFYFLLDVIRIFAPLLYIKISGSNYFALLKSFAR